MLYVQHVCQHVQPVLCRLTFVDNDGIIQVAALDEVSLQQGLNIANENKGTCAGYLLGIVQGIVKRGKLRVDELRLEGAHGCDGEVGIRQYGDARPRLVILYFYLLANDIKVLGSVLFFYTDLVNLVHVLDSRTIQNREFRAVDLHQTVVNAKCIESRETMLYR